nr:hypothetical protein [Tanacetum cinerariifolium]
DKHGLPPTKCLFKVTQLDPIPNSLVVGKGLEIQNNHQWGLEAAVLIGLAALTGATALEELCLAALTGTMPDLVKTAVVAKFLLEL